MVATVKANHSQNPNAHGASVHGGGIGVTPPFDITD